MDDNPYTILPMKKRESDSCRALIISQIVAVVAAAGLAEAAAAVKLQELLLIS